MYAVFGTWNFSTVVATSNRALMIAERTFQLVEQWITTFFVREGGEE
jgi:hypothetical protein